MDQSVMQTFGKVAGIGGLGLGVFLLLFREIIRKQVFPKLKEESAFRLIRQFMLLTFSVSVVGILAWVWTDRRAETKQTNTPPPISHAEPIHSLPIASTQPGENAPQASDGAAAKSSALHDSIMPLVKFTNVTCNQVGISVDGQRVASIKSSGRECEMSFPLSYSNREVRVEVSAPSHLQIIKTVRLAINHPTILAVDF